MIILEYILGFPYVYFKENMSTFESVWLDRVKMLTMAVDSLISFDDFLAVSEAHISEDCQNGIHVVS